MKLLIDDTTARTYCLNANEACVFAAILKCTKAGRGWFANYRDLAAALPFVISHETVRRAVEKLLNLGLIEKREKTLFALTQIVTESTQIVTEPTQNVTSLAQNVTNPVPPYNPPINNEKMNEIPATCAHSRNTRTPQTPTYIDLKEAYMDKGGLIPSFIGEIAENLWWSCTPAKKIKLLEAVKTGAHFKARLDWLIADFPEPQPVFLRGDEKDIDIVQVKVGNRFRLCSRETMNLFNLQWIKDWSSPS